MFHRVPPAQSLTVSRQAIPSWSQSRALQSSPEGLSTIQRDHDKRFPMELLSQPSATSNHHA